MICLIHLHTFGGMAMEFRHLRYIIAVAEEGHITRAAERLGIQQPPLSRLIKAVEHELKLQLFHRVPRGVELTDAGRTFLDGARATFANLDRVIESARRTARGEEGRISVGFTSSAAFHPLVSRVIREFRQSFPLVTMTLAEDGRADLIKSIESDRLDAAFIRADSTKLKGLLLHRLLEETLVLAFPRGHALARREARAVVPLNHLSEETFVVNRPHGPMRDAVFAACRAAGFSPRVQEAPHVISMLPLVAAGIGISMVPASLQHMNVRGVVYRRNGGTQAKVPLNLASRQGDTSAVVRQFVDLVRRTAKNIAVSDYQL
jgi:DNA-binding transcriptional LysR family regulator